MSGREGVELGHALDFSERHVVSVLEDVALVLVYSHDSWVALGDVGYNEILGLFAVLVVDHEFVAVIEEGESTGTVGGREDKANALGSAKFVDFDGMVDVGYVRVVYHVVSSVILEREG